MEEELPVITECLTLWSEFEPFFTFEQIVLSGLLSLTVMVIWRHFWNSFTHDHGIKIAIEQNGDRLQEPSFVSMPELVNKVDQFRKDFDNFFEEHYKSAMDIQKLFREEILIDNEKESQINRKNDKKNVIGHFLSQTVLL